MKRDLSAKTALDQLNDITREEKLLERLVEALRKAGIGNGYTGVHFSDGNKLCIAGDRYTSGVRTYLTVDVSPGRYSIQSDDDLNYPNRGDAKSPLDQRQMQDATGETDDHNTFISALEYIIAPHFPETGTDGKLEAVMVRFKRPEAAPALSPVVVSQGKPDFIH